LLSLNDFGGNDNLRSYPTEPFLTIGGVSFSLSDGNQINIFFGGPVYGAQDLNGRNLNAGTFSVSLETTTTPRPTALPLFVTGLGGLGLLGWRRKRKAQAVAQSLISKP
jgi:hypothetical protein